MSGGPIVPIQFFGDVVSHTEETFTVKPKSGVSDNGEHLSPKEVVEYVSNPDAKNVDFHATPVVPPAGGGSDEPAGVPPDGASSS